MKVYPEIFRDKLALYRPKARKEAANYLDIKSKSPAAALFLAQQAIPLSVEYQMVLLEEVYKLVLEGVKSEADVRNWMGDPLMKAIHEHHKSLVGEAAANSFVLDCWQRAAWARAGSKVYEIAPGLAEHLMNTEVHNVKAEYVQLPFRTIAIQVPWQAQLLMPARITDRMVGIVGGEVKSLGDTPVNCIMVSEAMDTFKGTAVRSWQVTVVADGQPGQIGAAMLPDFAYYTFQIHLPDDKTISECIAMRNKEIYSPKFRDTYPDPVWEKFFAFVLNFVLYLSYEPTCKAEEVLASKEYRQVRDRIHRLPHGPKREKLQARLKTIDPEARLYVGRDVPRIPTESEPGTGTPLTHRIMVTGHWRNQACGTNWQDHKMMWIRPFWKGKAGMPVHNPRRIAT